MTKKQDLKKCKKCDSTNLKIINFDDGISFDGKPIKEKEITCNDCNYKRTVEV